MKLTIPLLVWLAFGIFVNVWLDEYDFYLWIVWAVIQIASPTNFIFIDLKTRL